MNAVEEKHYSVEELAERWGISTDTVTRKFKDEPGVVNFATIKKTKRIRKPKAKLRIPQSVAERVYNRLTIKPKVA